MIHIKKFFLYFYLIIIIFIILSSLFIFNYNNFDYFESQESNSSNYYFSNQDFFWPVPGYHTITSQFGNRIAPTTGASTFHSGIDIAAPEGSIIYSILSGKIQFTGFNGANGYTITMQSNNLTILYCHVSPNYIVKNGDNISIGEAIGNVGPKYVPQIPENTYKDSTGKFTNGATTGPHLHLTIKKDGIAVNPLNFF